MWLRIFFSRSTPVRPSADDELIQKTLEGDPKAFAGLIARHGRSLYTQILRKVRYPADAEDLLQEVFLTAYTRLGQLRDRERLRAWMTTIAENHVRMWQRRRWVQLRWQNGLDAAGEMACHAEDEPAERQELKASVRLALRRLSEAYREVIVHHYFKGYTYLETAELLGLEVDTVRSRLQKGRKQLKKEMGNMTQESAHPQTYTLTRDDLRALRWATTFVSGDPQRPVLHGVYFEAGGNLVATNGHRLFLRAVQGLQSLQVPLLLGPWNDREIPASEQATLEVGTEEAILRSPDGPECRVPVMEGPFVRYEQVLPPDGKIQVGVTVGLLLEAIEQIVPQLEPQHPVEQEGVWTYRPQVEIRLSNLEQTLSLVTTRNLGYSLKEGARDEKPAALGADWVFSTSVPAQIEGEEPDDVFRTVVNHTSLSGVVQALELHGDETMALQFIDPQAVIQFTAPSPPHRRTFLLPLRRQVA